MRIWTIWITAAWAVLYLFSGLTGLSAAYGANLPSVRIMTFAANDPWNAIETHLVPDEHGLYQQKSMGPLAHFDNRPCEDLLNKYQSRSLKTMLERQYITRELYDQLMDNHNRAHDMRQYVLVTLYRDMPEEEAKKAGIESGRFLNMSSENNGKEAIAHVHFGSTFAVRGYDLERSGVEGGRVKPMRLPFEVGQLPSGLDHELNRENLPAAIEFGRAFIEKDGERGYFSLLMHVLVNILAADAQALGLDLNEIPTFGHALDSSHVRLFSQAFDGRPLTAQMQMELEKSPAQALRDFAAQPLPSREQWAQFSDAVVVGALQHLLKRYPQGALSAQYAHLKSKWPHLSAEEAFKFLRELHMLVRQDWDWMWHDPHRPGQRQPLRVHDWGTGLFEIRLLRLLKKYGLTQNVRSISEAMQQLGIESLSTDPDLGLEGWMERTVAIGLPDNFNSEMADTKELPTLTLSNLDPHVPFREQEAYLTQIILAFTWKIEQEIDSLSNEERLILIRNMQQTRRRLGKEPLASIADVNLEKYLETYDFNLASEDTSLATSLKILGADIRKGIKFLKPVHGGPIDTKIDVNLDQLGVTLEEALRNPQVIQERLQAFAQESVMKMMTSVLQPTKVYRMGWPEILEMRQENPQLGPAQSQMLTPSHHRKALERLYAPLF